MSESQRTGAPAASESTDRASGRASAAGGHAAQEPAGAEGRGAGASSGTSDARAGDHRDDRQHAQTAEQKLAELQQQYDRVQEALQQTRQQLEAVERRQRIDQLLVEADAVDLEAARLLTEAAVAQMDEADVELAVSELRRRKPYLFRRSASASAARGGMSVKPRNGHGAASQQDELAETAAMSGNRRDLLRYLRTRRGS